MCPGSSSFPSLEMTRDTHDTARQPYCELRRAIDAFLTGPMAEGLRAVECTPALPGSADSSLADAAKAGVQVSHVLGTPDARYRVTAHDDVLRMQIQLNVYRLVVLYTIPLRQMPNSEGLKPQFAQWQAGASHAGWSVGWRDTVQVDHDQRTAEIFCYAMLPMDFLSSLHHQLYWLNDVVEMTRALFSEAKRIDLRLS